MAVKLAPLYDRILVRRIPEAETSQGGIIIPDSAKEKPQEGEIVAVGEGKLNDKGNVIPLKVKVGDRIFFGKYAGTDAPPRLYFESEGEDYVVMREEEVMGILTGVGKRERETAGSRK